MTYKEKLLNPKWQKKRLEILQRDNFTCQLCSDTETELHIHHKEYSWDNEPWEYESDNFQTLCKRCHVSTEYLKESKCTPIISVKKNYTNLGCVVSCIIKNEMDVLMLSLIYIDESNKVFDLINLREESLEKFASLFNDARKLIQ